MHKYANPANYRALAARIRPLLTALFVLTVVPGLYLGLFASPEDGLQGHSVRIMYVHVPSAWVGMFLYLALAVASFIGLVWKHPLATLSAKAIAPVGALFTALALITGSLWGRPTWGTYWIWDGRITSVLVMLFLYLGYMALWQAMDNEEKAGRVTSLLGLAGVINLPIIKFSVDWWATLHQPASVMRLDGPSISSEMLTPLLLMALAFKAFAGVMVLDRIQLEMEKRRTQALTGQLSFMVDNGGELR